MATKKTPTAFPTTSIWLGHALHKRFKSFKLKMNTSEIARIAVEAAMDMLEARKKSHPKESDRQRMTTVEAEMMRRLSGK